MLTLWTLLACRTDAPPTPRSPIDAVDTAVTGDTAAAFVPEESADTGPLAPALRFTVEPAIGPGPDPDVHLVRLLSFTTDRPTTAVLTIDDGAGLRTIVFPATATAHALPLLGLAADVDHAITVTATDADGAAVTAALSVRPEPLGLQLPTLELLAAAPVREGGYTLLSAWSPGVPGTDRVLIVDDAGRPVWVWEPPGEPTAARLFHGALAAVVSHNVSVRTLLGEMVALYSDKPIAGATVVADSFHHDVVLDADGSFWSLQKGTRRVPDYPTAPDALDVTAPADVGVDRVVHLAADGSAIGTYELADVLDPTRVSFGSFNPSSDGFDWSHANAVWPVDGGAAFVVSLRHQDALVKLDATTGAVRWILANPDGWPAHLDALRLQPVGALEWPYHSHGISFDGDTLYVFDNGNDRRTTPYSNDPHRFGLFSRVVGYRIDEVAGTVEQVAEVALTPEGRMYSQALGQAQHLPVTGHVFATHAYLHEEAGVPNEDLGRGKNSARLIEWDLATGQPAWDLRITGDAAALPKGWLVDRATRVPSLYDGVAVETR